MSGGEEATEGRASARPAHGESNAQGETCGSMSLRKEEDTPRRHHPIHLAPSEVHNRSTIIFVTACTAGRRRILATPLAHEAITKAWIAASTWLVGRYVILPDHVHLFCAPGGLEAPPLEKWMRYWKSLVTRSIGERGGTVWQRHHWDRQLRSGDSYDSKWEYVRGNPVRHGYVANADDWPHQGELNELRW